MSTVEQIADAILYEGYILYPYRASALKNKQRWNFGVLYPPAFAAPQEGSDTSTMQCECFARGPNLVVTVRFLQLVAMGRLDSQGNLIHRWQEALTRDVEVTLNNAAQAASVVKCFLFPAQEHREATGEVVRRQESVAGMIEVSTLPVHDDWFRISIRISNCGAFEGGLTEAWSAREAALCRSLVSTHVILRVPGGQFASLLDPPEELRDVAVACKNFGTWPVLAGEENQRDAMLSSPIILYDYPKIAPESPGALFDGTEIDEILTLRIMTLTDEEKLEMAQVDERARQILERTESMPPEQFMKMHGVLRGFAGRGQEKP